MSERVRHVLMRSAVMALPIVLIGGLALAFIQQAPPVREIVLVAEGMAFHFPGDPEPNPPIAAAPGERLRLVLINRDRGYQHDLQLPTLSAGTSLLAGDGDRAEVKLTAPSRPGDHEYLCSLHPLMMRGTLRVR